MKILVVNPGATSTKIAIFEDEKELLKKTIEHSAEDISRFAKTMDQKDWRTSLVLDAVKEAGFDISTFNAICGRGGLMRHIPSGTYAINETMLSDMINAKFGEHASNMGAVIAHGIASKYGLPSFIADPVSTDEMDDVARVSGFKGMERLSFLHALNQKSMARKAAGILGKKYEDLNLIVAHMGGGVSVAAHKKGRIVDLFNVRDEGAFSMDRGGSLPLNQVIDMCFSGKSKAELKKMFSSQSGVYSYLGTRDFREVENRALAGDKEASQVYDALVYQHAKDIGAMAAVLKFDVDAIVLTGGMANSKKLCEGISSFVEKIAKVMVLPGEAEMSALAFGALSVLRGAPAKVY